MAQTHYLNAGFDLGLRPRSRQLEGSKLERQIRELTAQGLLGAREGDAVLVRMEVADEFLDYLDGCGVPVPGVLRHPELDLHAHLRPFGWSAEAIELNRLHRTPVEHPPLTVIRKVNSRSFALELETELASRAPHGAVIESPAELERFLSRTSGVGEWIVKSEFGNAGLANRRLRSRQLTAADRRFVEGLFEEDNRVVLEPWLARERDWSVVFDVPLDPTGVRIHDTMYTSEGGMIGASMHPDGPQDPSFVDDLKDMAQHVASRLDDEGYSGPVCADAFSWRDEATVRLRPLVDLNCRRSMSDGAYRLWRRIAPERAWYYRFFNRRKLTLPAELSQALAALGDRRYDRTRRRGVLLASPTSFAKLAVIFVADSRAETLALEQEFRARFES